MARPILRHQSGLLGRNSFLLAVLVLCLAAVSVWQLSGAKPKLQDGAAGERNVRVPPVPLPPGDRPGPAGAEGGAPAAARQGDLGAARAAYAKGVRAAQQGDHGAALAAFAQAAELDPTNVTHLNEAGRLAQLQGLHQKAEEFYQRALEVQREALGDADPKVADQLSRLAVLYRSQGRYEEALRLFDQALGINEDFYGPEDPTVAAGLAHKAMVHRELGRPDEAEFFYKQSISVAERVQGYESPGVIENIALLADLYESEGNSEEAQPLYERMLSLIESGQTIEGVDDLTLRHVLGSAELKKGNFEQAEKLFTDNLAQGEARYGKDDPRLQSQLSDLATLYRREEKWAETEEIYQRMLRNEQIAGGFEKPSVAVMLIAIAQVHEKQGAAYRDLGLETQALEQDQKTMSYYEWALAASQKAYGPEHETTISLQGAVDQMRQSGSTAP